MKLVTVAEMRAIEAEANAQGLSYEKMMENAGLGLAQAVQDIYATEKNKTVLGLIGSGNNGGDTLVALAALAKAGWKAIAYLTRQRQAEDPLIQALQKAGGEIFSYESDTGFKQLNSALKKSAILLDGILGTGFQLPLKDELTKLLVHIKSCAPLPHVVAVDCPSGVDCDRGSAAAEALPAEITVCMAAVKTGLLRFPAYSLVGQLRLVEIGLPEKLAAWKKINRRVIGAQMVSQVMPPRLPDAHKGTFGTAFIVAGSVNYPGAALLAARAAYRIGAGLVRLAAPGPLQSALAGGLPEATWLILPHETGVIAADAAGVLLSNLERVTAMLIGPGWGTEDTTGEFLKRLLYSEARRGGGKAAIGFMTSRETKKAGEAAKLPPLLIDADGLKLLARLPDWHKKLPAATILTPHPGEMAVLTGLKVEQIQEDRLNIAQKYAKTWGQIVVLKGALTVVAAPDGRVGVVPVASAALARAGTGDVLAGLITGLRAQGVPAFESAAAGAWIHAQGGLFAAHRVGSQASVLAGDVLESTANVLEWLERKRST